MKVFKVIFKDGKISYVMKESVENVKKYYLKLGENSSHLDEDYYLNLILSIEEY